MGRARANSDEGQLEYRTFCARTGLEDVDLADSVFYQLQAAPACNQSSFVSNKINLSHIQFKPFTLIYVIGFNTTIPTHLELRFTFRSLAAGSSVPLNSALP